MSFPPRHSSIWLLQPATRKFVLLLLGCLFFHLAGTWTLPLIDRDEPRFAEASREMLERGDYIVPFFNNEYRFDKPPLTYWAQTLSYRVFGENDFAARFPSAVAAALVALVLLAWGLRLGSETVGWWAAIIFTLCLQTFMHAKAAVADMWLVLFVTTAFWSAHRLLGDSLGNGRFRKWWWVFYASLALAFMAKGPVGWLPLLALVALKLFRHDLRLAKRFGFPLGLVLVLALVLAWGIPAGLRTNWEFLRIGLGRHVIDRSLVSMEGHGSNSLGGYLVTLPFYFLTVLLSFFPWSIKLPWLARTLRRQRDPADNYLIAGVAVVFLVFTLVKTKLPHYTLPAFPLLSLLLARHWSRVPGAARSFKRYAVVTGCILWAIALLLFPFAERYFPSVQLYRAAQRDLLPNMEFGAVGYNEPSLVWYFRDRVHGFFDSALEPDEVADFLAQSGPRFAIVPSQLAHELYPQLPNEWKSYRVDGFNIAKGKRVDLTLFLKP